MRAMRRALGAGVSAIALTATAWVACGTDSDSAPSDGGSDAGGAGGVAGTSPSGGGSSGGAGGSVGGAGGGGASDGGVDWGTEPKWEATGQVAAGCPIERLANPTELKAWVWKTCSWASDCQEAVFNPKLLGSDAAFTPGSSVHDDGSVVRIGLALESSKHSVIFASGDGVALDGIRGSLAADLCHFWTGSLWGSRLAVMTGPLGMDTRAGILADVGSNPESVTVFALQSQPFGVPQRTPLGSKRWLWWWVPVDRFSTVSAVDGSDFVMFAKAEQPGYALDYGDPVSTGSQFLFDEYQAQEVGLPQRVIAYSDGMTAPQTYLKPSASSDDYGSPAFANSQVGFFRGVNRIQENVYGSVELWSTPYSENPQQLAPKKIASVSLTSYGMARAGGWGRFAFPAFSPTFGKQEVLVWNLENAANASHVLPADHEVKALLGISRDHVYIAAAKPNTGPSAYLVRYPAP